MTAREACIANMRAIETAKAAWTLEKPGSNSLTITQAHSAPARRWVTNSLTRAEVSALLRSVVLADLPKGATDVYGYTLSLFTTALDVRFTCTRDELQLFLRQSPQLKDELDTDVRTVRDSMGIPTWWQPDALNSVSGSRQSWQRANRKVDADLICSEGGETGTVMVYLAITIE